MTIKLKGSSDGSVSLSAPADTSPSGTDITLTLPTDAGSANQFIKNSGTAGTLDYSSMVETSTGVGIGSSSPSSLLHLEGSAPKISLKHTATGSQGALRWVDSGGTVKSQIASYANVADSGNIEFCTNGTGTNMVLDSSGRLLLGTTSASPANSYSDNLVVSEAAANAGISIHGNNSNSNYASLYFGDAGSAQRAYLEAQLGSNGNFTVGTTGTGPIRFTNSGGERLRIDSSGRLGIGTSSPGVLVDAAGSNPTLRVRATTINTEVSTLRLTEDNSYVGAYVKYDGSTNLTHIGTHSAADSNTANDNNAITIVRDDRNVGIGTSSPTEKLTVTGGNIQVDASNRKIGFKLSGNSNAGYLMPYTSGGNTELVNERSGSSLIFKTANTEQMRIDGSGRVLIGTTTEGNSFADNLTIADSSHCGLTIRAGSTSTSSVFFSDATSGTGEYEGYIEYNHSIRKLNLGAGAVTRLTISQYGDVSINNVNGGGEALSINRSAADGTLIRFQQAGTTEGDIVVSGTTVSYNGGHLSRWSQLPGNAERIEILRGTVLSNIDEMCEWGDEDNEQLNRMKVSDVEGDRNVAGVFQNWDDSDEIYTADFYCAMTGDFVIRIAQGTTVARGDLLMSAGDGTAKPQNDDIVRSKTIAKVTSTNVTCTYDDGSYCVPCVLMAC